MKQENRIAEMRKRRGLTQEALADALQTTRAQIANLERGARSLTLHWMRRLAVELNCAPADLLVDADVGIRLAADEAEIIGMLRNLPTNLRDRIYRAAIVFALD